MAAPLTKVDVEQAVIVEVEHGESAEHGLDLMAFAGGGVAQLKDNAGRPGAIFKADGPGRLA